MKNMLPLQKLVLGIISLWAVIGWVKAESEMPVQDKVVYFAADTEVHYGMAGFIRRVLSQAKTENVRAVIMGIDTFGGRVDAALEIVRQIEASQPVPVYAWVEDKAWSAGALLALGCRAIYMRPGSSIGSATPVSSMGLGSDQALGEKYVSALRAKFRSVAEKNGYSSNLAAAMVDKDIEIREVILNGKKQYLTPDEIKLAQDKKQKIELGAVVNAKDKLLNLTAQQAFKYGLATAVVDDLPALLQQLGLAGLSVEKQTKNWAEMLAGFATSATISGILLMIGLFALYTELSHPGFGWAGIIGITALGLLFWGKYIVNLANMTELIIFAVGVALLLVEIFLIPGFGITGILGIILICVGLYLAFVPFVIPRYPWDVSLFLKTILTMLVSILVSIAGFLIFLHFIPEIPGIRRLVLTSTQRSEDGFSVASPEITEMVGWQGIAATDLRPVGKAQFGEKLLDVVAESAYIQKHTAVKIIDVKGNRILVRSLEG